VKPLNYNFRFTAEKTEAWVKLLRINRALNYKLRKAEEASPDVASREHRILPNQWVPETRHERFERISNATDALLKITEKKCS